MKTLRLLDVTEQAIEELAREMPPGTVRFEGEAGRDPKHGRDFSTVTAIVIVSEVALRVLAVWIARHTTREETEISIQTSRPDGSSKTVHIRSKSASAQSEAGVLRQLEAACKVDLDADPVEAIKGLIVDANGDEKPESPD